MATLEDIVAATKILSEDAETVMGGSGSKPKENGAKESDVGKDEGGSVVSERVVEPETVVESTIDGDTKLDCDLGDKEKERTRVENLSTVSGERNISVNGKDVGAVGSDGEDNNVEGPTNGEDTSTGYKESSEGGSNDLHQTLNGQDNAFLVGDFVWGKIKSHPWWPGQIYDPKDASEFAMKRKQEGRLLVAFFGDGSCSWCLPSQLIPFVENFVEMSKNSSSKSFQNAVEKAVDEVGRLVESEMTCNCILEERKDTLARPVVANAGLKDGIKMPGIDLHRLSIPKYESAEIVQKVRQLAKSVSAGSVLELAVLRSSLSAFYYYKGGYQLAVYHEPLDIEGLEDKNQNVSEVVDDFSVPIEVPILGPLSDNKSFHKRKQKSVAEIMRESKNTKPESKKRTTVKERSDFEKSASTQKRKKNNDGEVEGAGSKGASSTGKTGRKRKADVSESSKITDEKVLKAENAGVKGGSFLGKPKDIEVPDAENTSSAANEELETVSTPRERKKSKYLSPPYTNLAWRVGNSSFKSDSEGENDKTTRKSRVAERKTEATGDLSASRPLSESVDKAPEEKLPNGLQEKVDISVETNPQTVEKDKKMSFSASDVDAPVNELLSEIQLAALDPLYLSKKGSLDMVWAFVSALRSATYLHGSDYKIYRKCKTGAKRKSLLSELGNLGNDLTGKKAKSLDQNNPKASAAEGKSDISKSKKPAEPKRSAEKIEGKTFPSLILAFTPGFPLPSKEDIVKRFGKFGSLNTKETKVVKDSHSIKIVYMKDSDAEAAFRSSLIESPFGSENVNYKLQRSSAGSRSQKSHPKASSPLKRAADKRDSSEHSDDLVSDVSFIRQKIEIMTAILENYHSKFSPGDKSIVKAEMKLLLEKVETTSEKVRVMAENTSS
ncbi:Non-specific serine/threonine protein kinase [Handroanthus impetiginosus]|uniref:Non-specific serine/threonine protein kinase n=1 Tax=Handroanthus impetiginosus TaxID=429701 RepID=A0A2G9GHC9_9LAMI|nr:Non-specific serine/threonine protein kinase [Handroanthus impetiginosus]